LVGYIVHEYRDSDSQAASRLPIGTFFFAEHSIGPGAAGCVQYIVTCRHVIEGFIRDSPPKRMFIRVNSGPHGFAEDFEINVGDWVFVDNVDVAVARWTLPAQRQFWAYPVERRQPFGLFPGQNTFFIGMFAGAPGFVSVQAVVRTGNIARVISEVPLRFKADPEETTPCGVHLVEMHSWGGESGSPVFVFDERFPAETPYAFNPGYGPGNEHRPAILGVLHGQFEIAKPVMNDEREIGSANLNAGIGIVIPMRDIIATLHTPSLVEDRNREFERRKALATDVPRSD